MAKNSAPRLQTEVSEIDRQNAVPQVERKGNVEVTKQKNGTVIENAVAENPK